MQSALIGRCLVQAPEETATSQMKCMSCSSSRAVSWLPWGLALTVWPVSVWWGRFREPYQVEGLPLATLLLATSKTGSKCLHGAIQLCWYDLLAAWSLTPLITSFWLYLLPNKAAQ